MGLEFMVIGLQISKSALASYGEMAGITLPFIFDAMYFDRTFVMTDFLGLGLIIILQIANGYRSIKQAEEAELNKAKQLLEKNKDEEQDALDESKYKQQKVDAQDSSDNFKKNIN